MGNTSMVIGGIDGTKTYFIERVTTDQGQTGTGYAVSFKNIPETRQIDVASIEGAILSSVVLPANSTTLSAVEKVTGDCPLLIGSGMKTSMGIITDNPRTVGSNQAVGAVATNHEHPLPLMVIDMGTATTLYIADKRGSYIGGVTLSDLKVSPDSLSSETAQPLYISLEVPSYVIGKSTTDCTRPGVIYGNVDMIGGILDRTEEELGEPPTIIATGGLTKFIIPLYRHKVLAGDALLPKGLSILYRKNMEVH